MLELAGICRLSESFLVSMHTVVVSAMIVVPGASEKGAGTGVFLVLLK